MGKESSRMKGASRLVTSAVAALALVGVTLTSGSAMAGPQSKPNGPWVQDSQELKISSMHDYEQLTGKLRQLERSSGGRMTVESVGTSNEGRDIWMASVGTGDRDILYITQQHGDEIHATESALQALRTLSRSNHPDLRQIREELTLHMIVRANPDGSERAASHYWRQNYAPDCDFEENACTRGRGFDPNRWHDPQIPNEAVLVPETLAIRQAYERLQPELVVDYHNQVSYVSESGNSITTSVLWSMLPDDVEVTPERQHAIDYGRQVSRLIYDNIQDYGHAEVSLYPSSATANLLTARNAYGYQGSGSVLVETRGQAEQVGQKGSGALIRQLYVTMLDIASAAADGSVFDIDPASADEIPERGPRLGNPNAGKPGVRCPNISSDGEGEVRSDSGFIYDYVLAYESKIMPVRSDSYVRPTSDEACALQAAFEYLMAGEPELAAGLADPLDYDVVEFADHHSGDTHYVLEERTTEDVLDQRGWGMYVHAPESVTNVTIEAPNPSGIPNSQRFAAQAFQTLGARNLLVHGARNTTNSADDFDTSPANPRRNEDSVFHHIHLAAVGRGDVAIQTTGSNSGGSNEVAVTSGQVPPTELATTIGATYEEHGFDVCLFGDGECLRLADNGNIQGQAARAVGADFVALYPDAALRQTVANRQAMANALADALLPPAETPADSDPAQYATDFSDAAVGERPAGWTGMWRDGNFTVADDPARVRHRVDSAGRQALTWDAVGSSGHVQGDVEVAALLRVPAPMTSTRFVLPIHASGERPLENAFYLDVSGNNIRLNRYVDGSFSGRSSTALPFTFTADTWYHAVLRREGEVLQAKIWPAGTDEPGEWQVTATDDSHDGGRVGIGHLTNGAEVDWAFYGVGTGGEPAPRAPENVGTP